MKRTAKVISLLLTLAVMVSCTFIPVTSVYAADTTDYSLADNVQDGVILHAWNWSYNTIKENLQSIAQAGYTTVQTSPVQQPKNYSNSWVDIAGQWWKLYQPLNFAISDNTWLGTKADLQALCQEADKYGINIICDIVANHMANDLDGNPGTYYSEIADYEPEIFNNTSKYFHSYKGYTSDASIQATVQGVLGGLPDLNTGDSYIQNKVISLLKECIDVGVDGFRFDAAKHIETPDDGAYASDYWPNILNAATEYAQQTQSGKDLYYYGEVLNAPGTGRNISSYTKYMSVTENMTSNAIRTAVTSKSVTSAAQSAYAKGAAADKLVLWAESHDTYTEDGGSASVSNENIIKTWALVGARKDASALYLARPAGSTLMGEAGDTAWKSVAVSEINKFHNAFADQGEQVSSSGNFAYVERGNSGVVIVNIKGNAGAVSVDAKLMADGTYTDTITGGQFTVAGGKITGNVGSTGIAVVYNESTTPHISNTAESGLFKGESITFTLTLTNAASGTYQIDNGAAVPFTGTATVTAGENTPYGDTVTVKVTATNGTKTVTETYVYTKTEANNSGVFIYFDNSSTKWSNVFCYVYDEITDPENVVKNANWPGEAMTLFANGYYGYEIPQELVNSQVIFNNNAGSQQPGQNKPGYFIENKSMIFKDGKWSEYIDLNGKVRIGDSDLDDDITIKDVTLIQKYLANLETLSAEAQIAADSNEDGDIDITDATAIQRYCAGIATGTNIGEYKNIGTDPQPTNPQPSTEPEPTSTEPEPTVPIGDNVFYIVDTTGWLFESGCKIWVYNNDTKDAMESTKESPTDDSSRYSYVDLPEDWTNLSFYRTDYSVAELDLTKTDEIYNKWENLTYDGSVNAYHITGDGTGSFKEFDPEADPDLVPQTIYFDNSKTKWSEVYIYGWGNSGLGNAFHEMEKVSDTVYSYTFYGQFAAGGECFLFANKNAWTGQQQTINIAGAAGKDFFTNLTGSGTKWNGTWSVYTG